MKPSQHHSIAALLFVVAAFVVPASWSQPSPDLRTRADTLPLRNLQIEVRQLRQASQSERHLGASGAVVLQPGQSGARGNINAESNQRNDSTNLVQRVLVLNGRSANIMLGNSVPLRLVQGYIRDGVVRYTSSTVLVDANSGFSATPFWRGDGHAELALSAVQSSRSATALPGQTSVASTLVLPLNEWVTVAESDDAVSTSQAGLLGSSQSTARSGLTVQVRLSVR